MVGDQAAVVHRALERNAGPLSQTSVAAIFREIASAALSAGREQTVAYLGPPASPCHQAARAHFGHNAVCVQTETVAEAFAMVAAGKADSAVVPLENSAEGSVSETFDQVARRGRRPVARHCSLPHLVVALRRACAQFTVHAHSVHVVGEVFIPISHCLIARTQPADAAVDGTGAGTAELPADATTDALSASTPPAGAPFNRDAVTAVFGTRASLSQCRRWLAARLPRAQHRVAESAMHAAMMAARTPGTAALASPLAAELAGLGIVEEGVHDVAVGVGGPGTTRFLVLAPGGRYACHVSATGWRLTCVAARRSMDEYELAPPPAEGAPPRFKTTLLLVLDDRPGALYQVMGAFHRQRVNMSKIESFPSKLRAFTYNFFVELDGHAAEVRRQRPFHCRAAPEHRVACAGGGSGLDAGGGGAIVAPGGAGVVPRWRSSKVKEQ